MPEIMIHSRNGRMVLRFRNKSCPTLHLTREARRIRAVFGGPRGDILRPIRCELILLAVGEPAPFNSDQLAVSGSHEHFEGRSGDLRTASIAVEIHVVNAIRDRGRENFLDTEVG
jgi:hypothetical protein